MVPLPFLLLIEHFSSLQRQHTESLQTTQEQKTLIAQLEADLSRVQPFLMQVEGKERKEVGVSLSSADIITEALRGVEVVVDGSKASDVVVGGADSLLPIVSSQRERFRQRNVELEAVSA